MKRPHFGLLMLPVLLLLPLRLYADSSWHWLTVRPWDLLPLGIAATLLLETVIIARALAFAQMLKVFVAVFVANLVSFFAPYLWRLPALWRFGKPYYAFNGPYYTVGLYYLLLTLLVEVPLVFFLLVRHAKSRRRLCVSVITANVLSTLLVAGIEHLLARGTW